MNLCLVKIMRLLLPEGIEEYAKSLVDTMYKYGYRGIDLDYEPGYREFPGVPFSGPLVGPSYMCVLIIWIIWKCL